MRKIEVVVPAGKGGIIANIATNAGAKDSFVLRTHGPKSDQDIVCITSEEEYVDGILEKVKTYAQRKKIKLDVRLWKATTPLISEKESGVRSIPYEELKVQAYQSTSVDLTYLLLVTLSSILAALGLLQNSAIVIIGAMIIAPLLRPLMATSLGTVTGDLWLFLRGVAALLSGIIVGSMSVFLMCFLLPLARPTPLILTLSQLNLITIGVAFVAGIIAAVSMISQLSENLAGVSIAVALVPPMAALGINAFGWLSGISSFGLFGSVLLVIAVNCLAISVSGTIIFYLAGLPKKEEVKMLSTQLKATIFLLFILSVPFFYVAFESYSHSVTEETVKQISQNYATATGSILYDVRVEYKEPLQVTVIFLSKKDAPQNVENAFEASLEEALKRNVEARIIYLKSEPM